MFDIGWDEMALVAVVALIVIGPKDLPNVLRTAGHWARKARNLAGEFQRGVDDMVREADLHDLKTQVEKVGDTNALRRQVEAAIDPTGDIARALEAPKPDALEAPKPDALEAPAPDSPQSDASKPAELPPSPRPPEP